MTIALPRDANNQTIQITPAVVSVARTYNTSISSAVTVSLNASTTYLEVSAIDKGIFMKYAAGATSTDFDEFIPQNSTRQFVVPLGVTAVSFIEETTTAKLVCIQK